MNKFRLSPTLCAVLLGMALLASSATAFATTYTVTFATDTGTGSGTSGDLRYCVTHANSGDVINFSSAMNGATITLGSELPLNTAVTIDATSLTSMVVVTGTGGVNGKRLFRIAPSISVVLNALTLSNGNGMSTVSNGLGGAIYSQGQLTATGCFFLGNSATSGGGAIYTDSGGSVSLTQCTFTNNSCSAGDGGALGLLGSALNGPGTGLVRCSFTGNTANNGGAILAGAGTVALTQCTLSANSASVNGGAISANTPVSVNQSTVASNTASGQGGGIYIPASGGGLTLSNSIVALNTVNNAPSDLICDFGTVTHIGANFIGNTAGSGLTPGSTVLTGDPKLASAGVYGGITATMPPLVGSPVINASVGSTFTTDQRGLAITDGHPDLGAAEAIFTQVTNTNATGAGSLQDAITTAFTAGHAISFAASLNGSTINIGISGPLRITSGIIIDAGSLSGGLTITSGGFGANSSLIQIGSSAFFRGLTLANSGGATFGGGAIQSSGTVTLMQCVLSGNEAASGLSGGGAILNSSGILTLIQCTLAGNTSSSNGGAISNDSGIVILTQCTLSGNTADSDGGAIYNNSGTVTLTQCTISGNQAGFGTDQPGSGGGVYNRTGGTLTLTQCTVANNNAPTGGGIVNPTSSALTMDNSVVAENQAGTSPDISNSGTITLQGANLVGNLSGSGLTASSTLLTGNAEISPLGSYGGTLQTMPPLADSPLINAAVGSTFLTDERGCPIVGTADLGAAESSIINPSPSNGGNLPSGPETFSWTGPTGATFQMYLGTSATAMSSVASTGTTPSATLTVGLLSQATYYWRVDSTVSGVTFTGPTFTFTSPFNPAVTDAATTVLSGWATLNATVSPNPSGTNSAYFQYGTTPSYSSTTPTFNTPSGSGNVSLSYNLFGLAKGTTYHFRIVFVSGGTTYYGVDETFTTPATTSPPSWHSGQVTALTNPNLNNMADGARTGTADSARQQYWYKGIDNNIWVTYLNGSNWTQAQLSNDGNVSDWLTFGGQYNLLCYAGKDNQIWCVSWDGSKWVTAQLGVVSNGTTIAGDLAIDNSWNTVYFRGTDNLLHCVCWNGKAWVYSTIGTSPNANLKGNLVVDEKYHLVYYQGTDNNLWTFQWTGTQWVQYQLTTLSANVGGAVSVDPLGLTVYYRSSVDNSGCCVYWSGKAWIQETLVASANINASATSFSDATPYTSQYNSLYIDGNNQAEAMWFTGSAWTHGVLGDGASNLTGGLSLQPVYHWVFARRTDGNVIMFYYQ